MAIQEIRTSCFELLLQPAAASADKRVWPAVPLAGLS